MQKSLTDKKDYRCIVLENGIKAILISNPDATKSAAAMNVAVGSYDDPDDTPGLAHFLEHMLFMGTEDNPDEDCYEKYLDQHGGDYNAYTDDLNTVFYFSIMPQYFETMIQMFSGFFTCPLLKKDGVDREMKAFKVALLFSGFFSRVETVLYPDGGVS